MPKLAIISMTSLQRSRNMPKVSVLVLSGIWLVMESVPICMRIRRFRILQEKRKGILLQPGMTLAIEPMITEGSYEVVWLDDDWTVMTEDGGWAAHYENTILITENEPEILSL